MDSAPSELSMRRCCELLGINRSTLYYQARPVEIDDIDLLNSIRDIWERYPFYGYRRITKELEARGMHVNHKRVARVMAWGGIEAIYPGPNTSKRHQQQAIHRYLLRDIAIDHPNQVWQVDITYLHMLSGFIYLVAFIDVYSRYVVSWGLSNTLDTVFCMEALKQALLAAQPEIMNSDQGCQFTSDDWINYLQQHGIKVSMTGKGRCHDNIYIERFWRSFKREEFYLNDYDSVKSLQKAVSTYMEFYNQRRWHQSLGYQTPASVYFEQGKKLVDMWTSPSDQPAPFGACAQADG